MQAVVTEIVGAVRYKVKAGNQCNVFHGGSGFPQRFLNFKEGIKIPLHFVIYPPDRAEYKGFDTGMVFRQCCKNAL